MKEDFERWLRKRVSKEHVRRILSTLNRYAKGAIISTPKDVFEIKSKATDINGIVIALRNILNYAEEMDLLSEEQLYKMRKGLKFIKSNADAYVPSEDKVKETYQLINEPRQKLMFEILLTSGIRIREAVDLVNSFDKEKLETFDSFARYPLFELRHSKRAYYVYLPLAIAQKIERINITYKSVERYFQKRGLPAKYLRKWNYNFLIMHNVPESVADFIQGRSPISIGSMHYLAKVKQADYWYTKITNKLSEIFS